VATPLAAAPLVNRRRERFYTEAMEALLKEYWDLLVAMFRLYKAKDRWSRGSVGSVWESCERSRGGRSGGRARIKPVRLCVLR
jgi:hypothetical protein